jgi:hypothetical protein
MPEYQLLITDITNYGDLRCVAGWDLDRNKMIRPEPHREGFWQSTMVSPAGPFEIGKTAKFKAKKPNPSTAYPHFTEDRVVEGAVKTGTPPAGRTNILKHAAFSSLDELFDGNLVVDGFKGHVPVGAECRSLGGLIVDTKGVQIESYCNSFGKNRLRLRFTTRGTALAPNITSSQAYARHAAGELGAVNREIASASKLILRVGLARAFEAMPNRCYLQINGLAIL